MIVERGGTTDMTIYVASDKKGKELKDVIVAHLESLNLDVKDISKEGDKDFYDASVKAVNEVLKDVTKHKAIIIDEFGAGPFMVADKFKYIICAELNDEHSAKMTRDHNNSNVITMGSGIVGTEVAKRIAQRFAIADYAGGRHQIRVDMLNKMC